MLSERDEKINSTLTELAEVHEQLRCQESSLQQAYNHLASASRDKARVRQQLLENQTELTGVGLLAISTVTCRCCASTGTFDSDRNGVVPAHANQLFNEHAAYDNVGYHSQHVIGCVKLP